MNHGHNQEATWQTPIGQVRYFGGSSELNRIGGWYRRVQEKWIVGDRRYLWRLVVEYDMPIEPGFEPRHARKDDE